MNSELDWDDIKVFLAVARSGSLSQAARSLKRSQPTIGRRIEKIEKHLDLTLFKRTPYGYALTKTGEQLVKYAQGVADKTDMFKDKAKSLQSQLCTQRVSIASGDSFARLLTEHMHEFVSQNQRISLEITTGFDFMNIEKGDADIAIRSHRPSSPNLITRRLGQCAFAVYCSKSYLVKFPHVKHMYLTQKPNNWIVYKDERAELPSTRWLNSNINARNIKIYCNNHSTLVSSIKNGQGLAVIPCFIGKMEPELVKLSPVLKDLKPEIWLVLNRNAHRVSGIKLASQWVSQIFERYPSSVFG